MFPIASSAKFGLNRVVYGISGRPPAAFEWE
jgi:GMP synthase PP-ATPase subunit